MKQALRPQKGLAALRLGLALLVVCGLYFYNLGTPPLWGDEAGTGIFARNVIQHGIPTAFDGRNLSIYDNGAELNANLIVVKLPWLQFYWGALSMLVFGSDALGLRVLFALIGALSLIPLWAVLRSRVSAPLVISALVLATPQVFLFHRNARYYPLLTFLFCVVAWIVCDEGLTRKARAILGGLCMVLLFHIHPFAAATCCAGLMLQSYWQRDRLFPYLVSCLIGFGSWLGWWIHVGPALVTPTLFPDFQNLAYSRWPLVAIQNVRATLMDLDAVQGAPLLAWLSCVAWILIKRPHQLKSFGSDSLVRFVGLTFLVHVAATATLFGTETSEQFAVLRYMPHLVVMGMVLLCVFIQGLSKQTALSTLLCIALFSTNLLTLSYWTSANGASIPVSWWPATYGEILHPKVEALDEVARHVQAEANSEMDTSQVLSVVPPWLREVAIFYWGDKFIIAPELDDARSAAIVRSHIGDRAFARFQTPAQWILYEFPDAPATVPGYESIQLPVHRSHPHDGSRPELTRHTFYQDSPVGMITLYKKLR